ncbi:MAG: hypothetical protein AAF990_07725 [Bacteroidota bacterium]
MKFKTLDELLNSKFPFVIRWGIIIYCSVTLVVIYGVLSYQLSGTMTYDASKLIQADPNALVIGLDKSELPQVPDLQNIDISLLTPTGSIDLNGESIELSLQADSIRYTAYGDFQQLDPKNIGDIQLKYQFSLLNLLLGS